MQLSEVLELAAREGVRRHLEKRAGVMLPLAVGAMIPGIVHKAVQRAHATEQQLNHDPAPPYKMAALPLPLALPLAQMWQSMGKNVGGPLKNMGANAGGAAANFASKGLGQIADAPAGGIASGLSKLVERKMFGQEFGQRQDALGLGGRKALDAFSSEAGKAGFGLLRDIANKAMEAAGHAGDQAARDAIIGDLKRNDPVLAGADDATLMEAYHTMSRFAPVLSTDKNAVRSFLRQAVTSGSGPDFMSIKLVADAERAVTGGGDKKASLDLRTLLQAAAKPALAGAAVGGITGAIGDKEDRARGALQGALGGGLISGLGGAAYEHLHGGAPIGPVDPYVPAIRHTNGQGTTEAGPGWARWTRAQETGDKRASLDLKALLSAAAKPALAGAAVGGISGAIANKDDRGGGALRGALTGGALGGLGGAVHEHVQTAHEAPSYQGVRHGVVPVPGAIPYEARRLNALRNEAYMAPGLPVWSTKNLKLDPIVQGPVERWVTPDVLEFARELTKLEIP